MSQRPIRHYPPLSQSSGGYPESVSNNNSNSPLIVTPPLGQIAQPHHRCKCIFFIHILSQRPDFSKYVGDLIDILISVI